jgi:hypothetical protein
MLHGVIGENILPISIRVRSAESEFTLKVYNNINLEELIQLIAFRVNLEPQKISIKVVEDTVIRRVDRLKYNKDIPNVKNTLRDLKIVENSALLVEEKDPSEVEA